MPAVFQTIIVKLPLIFLAFILIRLKAPLFWEQCCLDCPQLPVFGSCVNLKQILLWGYYFYFYSWEQSPPTTNCWHYLQCIFPFYSQKLAPFDTLFPAACFWQEDLLKFVHSEHFSEQFLQDIFSFLRSIQQQWCYASWEFQFL